MHKRVCSLQVRSHLFSNDFLKPPLPLAFLSYSPEFIPPASDQLFVQPVDTGALAFDLLKMFLHFLPPLRLWKKHHQMI